MPERYLAQALEAEKLAASSASEAERRVHQEVADLWRELARKKAERTSSAQAASGPSGPGGSAGQTPPSPEIRMEIDEDRRRLTIWLVGDVDQQAVADRVSGLFLDQPRVTRMDMVYDLSRLGSGVGAAQMDQIAAAYLAGRGDPAQPFRTAIVAADPLYRRWAETLSRQFGREHRAFATHDDAEPFLSTPLESRPAFQPSA